MFKIIGNVFALIVTFILAYQIGYCRAVSKLDHKLDDVLKETDINDSCDYVRGMVAAIRKVRDYI